MEKWLHPVCEKTGLFTRHSRICLLALEISSPRLRDVESIYANQLPLILGRGAASGDKHKLDLSQYVSQETPLLSREHACIDFQDGRVNISDIGSRNGTYVNGACIGSRDQPCGEATCLTPGDEVRIGELVIRVLES